MSEGGRLLGLDYGEKRIGIALSDQLGLTARPYRIIQRNTNQADFALLQSIIKEEHVWKVVIGLPTNSEGGIGRQAEKVIKWAQKLAAEIDLPIMFWDESYSSESAAEIRYQSGKRSHQGKIDDAAAAVILQDYLDAGGASHEPGQPLDTLTGEGE